VSAGLAIVAKVARVGVAGELQALLDRTWLEIKSGLRRGLSIGFQALASTPLPGGGLRYDRWRWLETSVVVIPAQAAAGITASRAVPGRRVGAVSIR
jgi:hypothetical protein